MQAMGSCLTNKYAEGYPGKRYYGGCEVVDQSEQIAIDRLKEIFGAEWANVQPHSGAQANAAVFLAVLNPGDKFMGLNLAHGGHLSHGSLVNTSGIIYTPCEYNLNQETGRVDYDQMEEVALREKPKMIIGGGSAYSREWDYKRMREIADKVGAILMIDMAHPAGLIAAGLLENPVKYAHIVTSTTHKTLRGPRGGVIMMGKISLILGERKLRRVKSNDVSITGFSCIPRCTGRTVGTRNRCQSRSFRRNPATGIQGICKTGSEECCRTGTGFDRPWFYNRFRWYGQSLHAG